MAAHSRSVEGDRSSSWNAAAGRRKGSTGYFHPAVGAGFRSLKTSTILRPGQPGYLHNNIFFLCWYLLIFLGSYDSDFLASYFVL
jgi:hypothetical protein